MDPGPQPLSCLGGLRRAGRVAGRSASRVPQEGRRPRLVRRARRNRLLVRARSVRSTPADQAPVADRCAGSDGCGAVQSCLRPDYLGLLMPDEFPPRFEARQPITADQIRTGTRAWEAFTAADPMGLLPFSAAEHAHQAAAEHAEHSAAEHAEHAGHSAADHVDHAAALPWLAGAIRRYLEEFPSTATGLARSERQILQVLSEGVRTPEETFVEASR